MRHICTLLERKLGFGSEMFKNKDVTVLPACDTNNPHPTIQGELLAENNVLVEDASLPVDVESNAEREDGSFAPGIDNF